MVSAFNEIKKLSLLYLILRLCPWLQSKPALMKGGAEVDNVSLTVISPPYLYL